MRVRPEMTVAETLDALQGIDREVETLADLYVLDAEERLVGVVSLRELVTAPRDRPLRDIMTMQLVSVMPETDQEEVACLVASYNFIALPVTTADGRMLCIATVDDVIDALPATMGLDPGRLRRGVGHPGVGTGGAGANHCRAGGPGSLQRASLVCPGRAPGRSGGCRLSAGRTCTDPDLHRQAGARGPGCTAAECRDLRSAGRHAAVQQCPDAVANTHLCPRLPGYPLFLVLCARQRRSCAAGNRRMVHATIRHDFWNIWQIVDRILGSYLRSQLVLGLIVGVMTFLGLWGLSLAGISVPYITLLAIIAAFGELVPAIGPILNAVPALIVVSGDGRSAVLAVVALYIVIQQIESHILVPHISGNTLRLNPAILLLVQAAATGGVLLVIVAAPLTAVGRDLFVYLTRRLREPPLPPAAVPRDCYPMPEKR